MAVGTLDAKLQIEYQSAMIAMMSQWKATAKAMEKVMVGIDGKIEKGLVKPLKKAHIAGSKTYGYLKDVGRIVQGIFLSQILYRGILQPIQEAVKELWKFNMELERTELAFKYLLKTAKDAMLDTVQLAEILIKDLKIIAAQTPYTMKTVTDAATTLLALGFGEESLRPLLMVMADLSAATGGEADQMQKLAWALGRVQQQGRLTRRELRLFVTARVPIMKILEEQMGIQVFAQGMSIAANIAIPAILRGIMKFRGAAAEMEQTLSGLLSSLHDYFLFISRDIFKGFFEAIKERLSDLRERLAELWETFDQFGLEGIIAAMFPRDIALSIWQLIHVLGELGSVVANAWRAFAPLRKELMALSLVLINWLNTSFIILGKVMQIITGHATKLAIVMRVLAGALVGLMVARIVTGALLRLIKIFVVLSATGLTVVKIIGLVIGALAMLALTIPSVQRWFSNLGNRILKFFGIQIPQSIMITKAAISGVGSELTDIDWQKLIDSFSDVEDNVKDDMESIGNEAEKAKKKLGKFLLAFDEVYAIPEKAATLKLPEVEDFKIPELIGEIPVEQYYDDMADVAEIATEDIGDSFKDLGQNILAFFKNLWRNWIKLVDEIINATLDYIGDTWRLVKDLTIDLVKLTKDYIVDMWNIWKNYFIDLWNLIKNYVLDIWNIWKSYFVDMGNLIKNYILDMWNILKQFFVDLWNLITTGAWGEIGELFKKLFSDIGERTMQFFGDIWERTHKFITDLGARTIAFFEDIWNRTHKLITDLGARAIKFVGDVTKRIWKFFEDFGELTLKYLERVNAAIETFLLNSFGKFGEWLLQLGKKIGMMVEKILIVLLRVVLKGADAIKDVTVAVENFFERIVLGFISATNAMLQTIKEMVNSVLRLINKIPKINIPLIGEQSISTGVGVGVRGMQHGGILNKEQVVRAAEGGVREAYTPLTAEALKPWAQAIATALGGTGGGGTSMQETGYVAVPIDQKGMIDLERKLFVLRRRENIRRSVEATV